MNVWKRYQLFLDFWARVNPGFPPPNLKKWRMMVND